MIWKLGNNIFLKSNTIEKNRIIIAFNYIKLYAIYKRKEKFFETNYDDFFKQVAIREDKSFSVNKIDDSEIVYDNFIDDRLTSKTNLDIPKINFFKDIKEFQNLQNPRFQFISDFLKSISVLIQPTNLIDKRGRYE
jgi:hypothetical protein